MFIEEWDENTGINWWDENRKRLNEVIKEYNQHMEKSLIITAKAEHLLKTLKDGNYGEDLNKIIDRLRITETDDC